MASSVRTFETASILKIVNLLRSDGASASLLFDEPLSGAQCLIYAVGFRDGTTWAVRIPAHTSHLQPEAITYNLDTEVSILKHLEAKGFSWSPKLIGYDCGFNNPIEYPYLVLTWIQGTALEWSDTVPQRENRNKILRQMANIILELAESTKELSSTTALEYLRDKIDRKVIRVYINQMPGVRLRDCFIQRALARSKVVHPCLDESTCMVISHDDLAAQNIIVDREYNIKGIIDWGFAATIPLQFAASFPRFLAIEPQTDAPPNASYTFSSEFLRPSPVLSADREYFVDSLRNLSHPSTLAQSIHMVLSAPDTDWRNLIFEAAGSKGLHKWMANTNWLVSEEIPTTSDLEREVEGFGEGYFGMVSVVSPEKLLRAIKNHTED